MRVSSSGSAVVAALVCVATLPTPAFAQRVAASESGGQGDEKEARRLFQKAELSFNLGKFEEALGDYQAAYQAKPLTGFLFNIAQCYRNLGNWERARFFYRRYLTLEPRTPNRHRVEDLVREMTERLDKQQATPPPPVVPAPVVPPAAAPVDGTLPPSEPSAVVAPAVVQPAPAPPPAVEPSAVAAAPDTASATLVSHPSPVESRPVYKRWWFWGGVGALVVGGVVAGFVLGRPTTRTPGSLDPIDAR